MVSINLTLSRFNLLLLPTNDTHHHNTRSNMLREEESTLRVTHLCLVGGPAVFVGAWAIAKGVLMLLDESAVNKASTLWDKNGSDSEFKV